MKKKALVKLSGSLLRSSKVLRWLKELTKIYRVVILVGGGDQINQAFRRRGWTIDFGPFGRKTESTEQQRVQRMVLKKNQASVRMLLAKHRIRAKVGIPVISVAGELCNVNGDTLALIVYDSFEKIFVVTKGADRQNIKQAAFHNSGLRHNSGDPLHKIEVVAF